MPAKRTRPQARAAATAATAALERTPQYAWTRRFAGLGKSPLGYLLASILTLLPCYWGAYIQAGDLSSHIYNSWLAQFVETQRPSGLIIVRQVTNILFDLILSGLFRALGPGLAQRTGFTQRVRRRLTDPNRVSKGADDWYCRGRPFNSRGVRPDIFRIRFVININTGGFLYITTISLICSWKCRVFKPSLRGQLPMGGWRDDTHRHVA